MSETGIIMQNAHMFLTAVLSNCTVPGAAESLGERQAGRAPKISISAYFQMESWSYTEFTPF